MFKKLVLATVLPIFNLPSLWAMEASLSSYSPINLTVRKVPTIEEFNKIIENNNFLKQHFANQKMDKESEENFIIKALQYQHSTGGGIINRPLSEFKGNTLLIGGGKKGGLSEVSSSGHNLGITNIELYEKEIIQIESGTFKGQYSSMTGIKLDSEENKQRALQELYNHIESTLNTYYTVNLAPETDPDLIASITNINDMSSIPDNYFEHVIFENVDTLIWLNPNIFTILERITKPGGMIVLDGVMQPRLLVASFAHTKWADQLNKQVEDELTHKNWGVNSSRLIITLNN